MPRAVVMRAYGPPSVLAVEEVPPRPLAAGEVRVRALASAVNHSDLEIRAGNWPIARPDPFPYVPGLEVVGEVVEVGPGVAGRRVGERVVTMMQGLGGVRAERPGGYAEEVVVAASSLAPVPPPVDPLDVAALGLAAVTAFEGLAKLGPLTGRRVVVTGASGGVGSAAVSIASALGAEVVGTVSSSGKAEYVRGLGAREVLLVSDVVAGALGWATLDGVLDSVAGDAFPALTGALRVGGTLSVVGAVGGSEVKLDAYRLLEVTLTGYSSESLTGPRLREAMGVLTRLLAEGKLRAPARAVLPLAHAAEAHQRLEDHAVQGRVLLVPG